MSGALPESGAVLAATGVELRSLHTLAAVREATALLARIWRSAPGAPPLTAEVVRAVEHAGGYAVGAYRGTELVATSVAFLGMDGTTPVLHSHISGALAPGGGVGLALKLHQRDWCLARGVPRITWTFDPLVRRNAWFNLAKLGAVGVEYLVDFYGPMADGVNAGEPSDRLFTVWELERPTPGARDVRGSLVLDAVEDAPVVLADPPTDAPVLALRLPADVEALRASRPAVASAWRLAVREVLVPAFGAGRRASGMTADGQLLLTLEPRSKPE